MIPARSFVLSVVNKVCAYRILRKNIENTIRKKWEHNYMKKKNGFFHLSSFSRPSGMLFFIATSSPLPVLCVLSEEILRPCSDT